MTRRILLADADAFYVSVARLVDPEGAGKARLLIVGGSPQGRGVVTSASYEARRYGVHSAMPMARAVRLCPRAMVVPVPWRACAEKSAEIREVLERFAPVVETASSDEYYLDLTGTEALYKHEPLEETARRIREAVLKKTRIAVSIGGGTSKLVAKLAAGVAKPRAGAGGGRRGEVAGLGVCVVPAGGEGEFMRWFALADIPFVGPRFQERLARYNLRTVDDALGAGRERLVGWLGEREGEWLWDAARGVDHSEVSAGSEPKSISRDETFAEDIDDDEELRQELLALVDRAASDLREEGLLARTVTVRIRDRDFRDRQASRTLPQPVCTERAVMRVAKELLARLRSARRVPARLLGVALSQLVGEDAPAQLSLLPAAPGEVVESEKDRKVAKVVDELRRKLGEGVVVRVPEGDRKER
jgi:DNA polymerase-4